MRALVLSDLHLEHGLSLNPPAVDTFDIVLLVGDIHSPGTKAVRWAQRDSTFGGKPVLLIPGNHEFYGREMTAELAEMRRAADGSNVHVLDCDEVILEGVRFLGCTLWTDFQLPVRMPDGSMDADVAAALRTANLRVRDFELIEVETQLKRTHRTSAARRRLRAEDTLAMHWVRRDWLRRRLAEPFEGPTVVVTHHAPSAGSVAERWSADWCTPAFVSDLPAEFFAVPCLWVHGHTHTSFDYQVGRCRVVCNPRGYRVQSGAMENAHFDPGMGVAVPGAAMGAPVGVPQQERLLAADMLDLDAAAALTSRSVRDLEAAVRRGDCLALSGVDGSLRLPKWQFEPAFAGVVTRITGAIGTKEPWALLAALETPLGALGGITPRQAVERGDAQRAIDALGYD